MSVVSAPHHSHYFSLEESKKLDEEAIDELIGIKNVPDLASFLDNFNLGINKVRIGVLNLSKESKLLEQDFSKLEEVARALAKTANQSCNLSYIAQKRLTDIRTMAENINHEDSNDDYNLRRLERSQESLTSAIREMAAAIKSLETGLAEVEDLATMYRLTSERNDTMMDVGDDSVGYVQASVTTFVP